MLEIERVLSIGVTESGVLQDSFPYSPTAQLTPTQTALFREASNLPAALEAIYERRRGSSKLRLRSAGCSIGAEVDSLLAHINRAAWRPDVSIEGWDINGYALMLARQSGYTAPLDTDWLRYMDMPKWEPEDLEATLSKYHFDYKSPKPGEKSYRIDSRHVRYPHEVEFKECDLSEATPPGEPADLITANHILHHLPVPKAEAVLGNLARSLAEGGVLSIGNGDYWYHPMRDEAGRHSTTYGQWLTGALNELCPSIGLEPIAFGERDMPTVFEKG